MADQKVTETKSIRRFVECAHLDEISLENCNLSAQRANAKSHGIVEIQFSIDPALDKKDGGASYRALCKCTVKGRTEDDKPILDLSVTYSLLYSCSEVHDWPEDEINHFSNRNVIIHVWPYLRQFIDDLSGRANLSRVILPLLPPGAVKPADQPAPQQEAPPQK